MLDNLRIVLVNTSHPGNIGSAARAMKTMGISQLVLVDPHRITSYNVCYTKSLRINVATIQSRLGSNFRITGIDNPQEAHNLALLLRAGALIAPIQIVEERTIGPSLGQQNINNGMQAMMFGLGVVMIFMVIYYRMFGLVANLALVLNVVLMVGVMSMIPGASYNFV